jgi:hypothetical protein
MRKVIYEIPKKMIGYHDLEINSMIDIWTNLIATVDQFKSTIHDIGIPYAKENNIKTWIVDTGTSQGVFKSEEKEYIDNVIAPKCEDIGIEYFFVILGTNALTNLSVKKVVQINAAQKGMQTLMVESMNEILQIQKEINLYK